MPAPRIDIHDGDLSNRILEALMASPARELTSLYERSMFYTAPSAPLTHKSLKFNHIEDYAVATGRSLNYFLFETDTQPIPEYTPFDKEVIQILNILPKNQLLNLENAILTFCGSPLMKDIPDTFSARIRAVMLRSGIAFSQELLDSSAPIPDGRTYRKDPRIELTRLVREHHRSPSVVVDANYAVDLATYFSTSAHWIFQFQKFPLFCQSIEAERVFSLYTLMRENHQPLFFGLLMRFSGINDRKLMDRVFQERQVSANVNL